MKNHWLRGMLLGVSMAVVLAGGVALAQSVGVDQECFECWPGVEVPTDQDYIVWFDFTGVTEEFYCEATNNGVLWNENYVDLRFDVPILWASCEDGIGEVLPYRTNPKPFVTPEYGNLVLRFWWETQPPNPYDAELTVLFAEVCPAAEFVPEPGSILLLGSGLAGLAGYAGLRWRTRE